MNAPARVSLARVVLHEARMLAADRTLWLVLALLGSVAAYGAANGASWVRFQRATLDAAATEQAERLGKLESRLEAIARDPDAPVSPLDDPRSPATVGATTGAQYAALPPGPLADLAVGQGDLLPYYVKVTTQAKQTFLNNDEIENPTHLLLGRFDLGFVVVTLFPLVILGLSYNLLSSEREGGTLALVLSQPVRLRTIVLGKVLIRVLATMLITVAIGWGASRIGAGGSAADTGLAARWLGWLAVVLAYGAFWFALAVGVNALGRSSATNAVMLIAAWLAFALVIPSVINLVAAVAYPVPSRVELVQTTRKATTEASAQGSRLLAQYFEDHPELAGPAAGGTEDFAARAYTVQDAVERQVAPLLERFDEQLRRQHAVIGWARFFSPAILAQEALQDIAGTGKARYAAYQAQIDAFHQQWREFLLPLIFQKRPFTIEEFRAMPRYEFAEEPASEVSGRVAVGLAGILAPTLALAVIGTRALRRYPVAGN